jgi:hypothetical protein
MAALPHGLTEPNVIALRAQLAQKYRAEPTTASVVDGILGELEDGWKFHQGMETASFDELNARILPHLETLLTLGDASRARPYTNALIQDWQSIKIDWLP